ncbi:acyltransferase [Fulvivirga maritima]|uniref:acyltransferase n=1 Tax=Fulvivirga maritima TaxID=2904247 RepID=UPI001F17F41A|nr:acyltransferase [Fulvivirga maritima]UII24834.1 acyltransferase [Fulvivirga maritima]
MIALTQYYITQFRPKIRALLTRILYAGRVKIGSGFRADNVPRILVDEGCTLSIGNNVEFRRNVEIRVHGTASVIIGDNVRIDRGVRILAANNSRIEISDGVRIGLYSVLNGGDSISIGRKSLVSGFVYLQTSMHGYAKQTESIQEQGYDHAPVILEEDTWLGTHVTILPGTHIFKGGIVGSNAVVNKNVEPYQVVGGVPAKPLKNRE